MYQEVFNRLYDKLFKYAYSRAARYFNDTGLCDDVADKAMEDVVVYWTNRQDGYNEGKAREIICNSVRDCSRTRHKLEAEDKKVPMYEEL